MKKTMRHQGDNNSSINRLLLKGHNHNPRLLTRTASTQSTKISSSTEGPYKESLLPPGIKGGVATCRSEDKASVLGATEHLKVCLYYIYIL